MLKSFQTFRLSSLSSIMSLYYAVTGPKAGIFNTWDEAKACTHGVSGARCKKFKTLQEAKNYLADSNHEFYSAEQLPENQLSEARLASKILSNKDSDFYKPVAVKKKFEFNASSKRTSYDLISKKLELLNKKKKESSNLPQSCCSPFSEANGSNSKRSRSPSSLISVKSDFSLKKRKIIKEVISSSDSDEDSPVANLKKVTVSSENQSGTNEIISISDSDSEPASKSGYNEDMWGDDDVFDAIPEHLLTGDATKSSSSASLSSRKTNSSNITTLMDSSTGGGGIHPLNSSCHTNGHSGSGMNFMYTVNGFVMVYTDGACSKNGRKGAQAGIGVWFNHNHPLNLAEPVIGSATNNNAEIQAATRAMQQAISAGVTKLNINTDSQFLIQCITQWIHSWKKNGWQLSSGGAVKNKEKLVELDKTMKSLASVSWTYVKSHVGIVGNEAADKLARQGALMYKADPSNHSDADSEDEDDSPDADMWHEWGVDPCDAVPSGGSSEAAPKTEPRCGQTHQDSSTVEPSHPKIPVHVHKDEDSCTNSPKEKNSEFSDFIYDRYECVKVFADGACFNNGQVGAQAGIGVWFNTNHPLNLCEAVQGRATNINAVIQSATRAIHQASKGGITRLNVIVDSKFLYQCVMEWLPKWKLNGWQSAGGGDIKNRQEFEQLDAAIRSLPLVTWDCVKGHTGVIGNESADQLAKEGALKYKLHLNEKQI